jgi:hypothetical protein
MFLIARKSALATLLPSMPVHSVRGERGTALLFSASLNTSALIAMRRETIHPLELLFRSKGFLNGEGMDWLQGEAPGIHGRLIADCCVDPCDVADCDVDAVLRLANARHFIPVERRTDEDLRMMGRVDR